MVKLLYSELYEAKLGSLVESACHKVLFVEYMCQEATEDPSRKLMNEFDRLVDLVFCRFVGRMVDARDVASDHPSTAARIMFVAL
mmetsp:Transcript_9959/g.20600  ORF Transcript_9959/g.20600 Transcript_9959/m.20600 type:complete len:85 (-) Transcript_9959:235-489(-)